RLRVSSQAMSIASPVFAAMFNGRFSEGQNLSSASPKEVDLPDDDDKLMTWLVKIIHSKTLDMPKSIDVQELAQFGVLCDKYDCVEATRPWSKTWVSQVITKPGIANSIMAEKLLSATYIFDLPHEFEQITRMMIIDRDAP
ncbi:hypothetical protein K491DRAFT_555608, partial [Lophiostoma macrostomum CBS 122681]